MRGKLTDELEERICQVLAAGNFEKVAAIEAGINERTYHYWKTAGFKAQDKDPKTLTKEEARRLLFYQRVTRAAARSEVVSITTIKAAGKEDWRAEAWLVERRHQGRWGKQQRVELAGAIEQKHSGEVKVEVGKLSDDDLNTQMDDMLRGPDS